MTFVERYGPWAVIAGASVGLGEAFARQLAARGLNLCLLARTQATLEGLAAELRADHRVDVRILAGDLARPDLAAAVEGLSAGLEVGLLVYNAAHSVPGPFVERPLEQQFRVLDVNCRGPLLLSHLFGAAMVQRGRGGIILMSSIAGSQGGPLLASYAASKAFNLVFAEGLWDELGRRGVDILACRAGAVRTPGYAATRPKEDAGPLMEPAAVVADTLAALGSGPSIVPGWFNKIVAFLFGRVLPRRWAIRIMGRAAEKMYG